jgi:uncharacterized protein with HEPN domain
MAGKNPLVYVMHIHDSCLRISEYVRQGGAEWISNSLVMDAVCRQITIIGEAARRVEEPFRRAHPEIPWAGLVGARNIVMHAYESVRPALIRDMAERDVPELLAHCVRILCAAGLKS